MYLFLRMKFFMLSYFSHGIHCHTIFYVPDPEIITFILCNEAYKSSINKIINLDCILCTIICGYKHCSF